MGDPESAQVQKKPVTITNCSFCDKKYRHYRSFLHHVRKAHPEHSQEFSQRNDTKTYKYKCSDCNKRYSNTFNLKRHTKVVHGVKPQLLKKRKCSLCNEKFSKADILQHFEEVHNFKISETALEFSSFEDVLKWKEETEKITESKYNLDSGVTRNLGNNVYRFGCHCSGEFKSKGKGKRRLKILGSKKIGGYCPAGIKVTEFKDGKCTVILINTHVGHDKDFGLTKKELIARNKIVIKKRKRRKTEQCKNKPTKVASPKLSIQSFQTEVTKQINDKITKVASPKFYIESFQKESTKQVKDKIIILASSKLSIGSFKKEVKKNFDDILDLATTREEVEIIERHVMSAKTNMLAMQKKAFFENFQKEIRYSYL